jgi:hypothetical protein
MDALTLVMSGHLLLLQVVHIDLGIAFEQGLFLQTPERVPFRLTNNIVDGMGAAGVEGTFRRCCETAMQVKMTGARVHWPCRVAMCLKRPEQPQ